MAWFETWFDTPYYHILYKDRDFAEAENFITLLINYLNIQKDSKIIDLACGKGRHSVFLNKMGFEVLGLDLSQRSIEHNKQFENSSLTFEVHDMRDEIFTQLSTQKADAVLNLFTSFGYFEDENDDRKVFQSISNILKDDGYFVLDFLNAKWVENTLVKEEIITKEGIAFTIKKKIEDQHVIKDISFKDGGEDLHFFEKVKLHTLEEMNVYAAEFDLERVQVFGDYQLNEFTLESSPRCITVFKKKSHQ